MTKIPEHGTSPESTTPENEFNVTRRAALYCGVAGGSLSVAGCLDRGSGSAGTSEAEIDDQMQKRALDTGLAARKSVVRVESATGWLIKEDVVLTCSHVIDSDTAELETFEGKTIEGRVLGEHENVDLALVEAKGTNHDPLTLDVSFEATSESNIPLVQIGHPTAIGSWVISYGSFDRPHDSGFLADIPCGPGSSGSPLLTLSGKVVGFIMGTTVSVDDPSDEHQPETVFTDFPGQRLLGRAADPETIRKCVDHLI
ncbi:serine protease [Halobacteria archaeon AArc-curdl1]|uniref:Serine protease n=1 Tax=Natronosalvus hydrolyticus TaxID=2979988 RepID=A0AAP3E6D6_9EURY|nr:serine protease [Halobacteria archaeon AArc-curdl1]